MGLIHHSNYLKWMEEGRIAFMDEMGLSYKEMEETGIASPVVEVSVQYRQPVAFDDEVEIRISVEKYTGAVLEVAYDIFNVTKDKLSAQAQSKHCFLKGGRPGSLEERNERKFQSNLAGRCEGNDGIGGRSCDRGRPPSGRI